MSNSYVTPQEIQDYGQEFLDVVGRKARETTAGQIGQLQLHVQSLCNQLHGQARRAMTEQLDRTVPDWRQVNEDPAFLQWLAGRNDYSGRIRHDELREAWA